MDGLAFSISAAAASSFSVNRSLVNLVSSRTLNLRPRKSRFSVLASKDNPELDKWDQMELKFGRLLGEDPKLTLAKVMGRKLNPDVSYLEIEKSFYKNKGKPLYSDIEEVPFEVDGSDRVQSSSSRKGLNLVRPVPKKGIKFEDEEKSKNELNLVRPVPKKGTKFEGVEKTNAPVIKKPGRSGGKELEGSSKGAMPNVILRKPSLFYEGDEDTEKSSRLRIEPNLLLKMGKEPKRQNFSDITLLKKPEPRIVNANIDSQQVPALVPKSEDIDDIGENSMAGMSVSVEAVNASKSKSVESGVGSDLQEPEMEDNLTLGKQLLEKNDVKSAEVKTAASEATARKLVDSNIMYGTEAPLQGKLKREKSNTSALQTVCENPEHRVYAAEIEEFPATSTLKEREVIDWTRAEDLAKNERKEEVELISCSTKGFLVSFGSLIGFLPYRNLAAKLKFLAFETWLRKKGLDPSMCKQNLGTIGNYEVSKKNSLHDSSPDPNINSEVEKEILSDMKLDELLRIYDQQKIKFLSSFVSQKIKVNVMLADRKSRKLIVSMRPKEKEEFVEKKRSLMAKLRIGDVVKCCIKKITYFGIFVEVEGVPALILQTEVSWDATLDPASYFKIGQIVQAKVHQLDFSLERIFLSLKEITPDPLIEALECVVGDRNYLDGRLEEASQADSEWADVESLVRELKNMEGVQSVSKGRFFLSPGLTPTFQVYMASMFENQYKLLARSENKAQEVIVQASLQKEEMKSVILTCTNRVA